MSKNRLKSKEEKDKIFSKIGEKQIKHIKSEPKPLIISRKILYDEITGQYSCKFPKEIMHNIDYKEGDEIEFTLIFPKEIPREPELKMRYKSK